MIYKKINFKICFLKTVLFKKNPRILWMAYNKFIVENR